LFIHHILFYYSGKPKKISGPSFQADNAPKRTVTGELNTLSPCGGNPLHIRSSKAS